MLTMGNQLIPARRQPTRVQRDEFASVLEDYRRKHPFLPEYVGMRDPYTGTIISTAGEYDCYLREYVFHTACDEAYRKAARRKVRAAAMGICAAAFALIVFIIVFVIPQARHDSYSAGYADGVKEAGIDSGERALSPPEAPVQPQPEAKDTGTIVYITDSGEKYHRSGCSYLANSSHAISLADAAARGYAPCSRCNPPDCKYSYHS